MPDPTIIITEIGGNCPVQAEGTIDGKPFYFRARGALWSLGVGGEPCGEPEWECVEPYGVWPDAGWITEDQARGFIAQAARQWKEKNDVTR